MTGRIKKVNQNGTGFIVGDDGVERFFMAQWLAGVSFDAVQPGMSVRFKPVAAPSRMVRAEARYVEAACTL